MKKNVMFGLIALAVVGLALGSYSTAYKGDQSLKGPNCNEERHEQMTAAFEAGDYAAWRSLMEGNPGRHRVTEVVTEENFATFVQAHEAGENGDYETASALREELGLNNGDGPKDGSGRGNGSGQGKGNGQGNGMNQGNGRRMQHKNL